MTTIHKYPLNMSCAQSVKMNRGAQVLDVQMQQGTLCLWAMVDNKQPMEARVFEVYGTGNDIHPAKRNYIATVQCDVFVWHVFESLS